LADGGVPAFEKRAIARAKKIYDTIDNSNGFYTNDVDPQYRSRMSIIFRIKNANTELEKLFVR
jgi:phosphoserine aminotransferase